MVDWVNTLKRFKHLTTTYKSVSTYPVINLRLYSSYDAPTFRYWKYLRFYAFTLPSEIYFNKNTAIEKYMRFKQKLMYRAQYVPRFSLTVE